MAFANLDGVILGKDCPKIITPITPRTLEELERQALELGGQKLEDYKGRELAYDTNGLEGSKPTFISDIVEWRIDCYEHALDPSAITHAAAILRSRTPLPILATFRTTPEGGEKDLATGQYIRLLTTLANSGSVAGIDVELSRGREVIATILHAAHSAGSSVVASVHDFKATPSTQSIVDTLTAMEDSGADIAKFVCMPKDAGDTLALMQATWQASQKLNIPIITAAMGPTGTISRVAGSLFGSSATFATVGDASAPGQVPASVLKPILTTIEKWAEEA
ncbi:type I 3-dehydroquinate dehydratase [Ancrocorticia populi]|uniref:3-dehydroquinate dehydratase n=1 Tax=Ancrocorticia populi TaxID=2175228 RepID=A0A2V1K1F5_9ACTO|nr:type I 3-dehydroquinate dehydratase [Ancrocorticia populi]PWF24360.1 type I 3-dehydroquinate dehydratase [Ancrocorticia populi]